MMNEGFIKLSRKFTEWEWYKNETTKSVFLHCLFKANWKDGRFEGKTIPRGSFVTSRKNLAKELNLSEQSVRTALKHLKSTNELTIETTTKFSIITVVKYDEYQSTNQQTNQQPTNNQPTTNHNRRNKEYQEGKSVATPRKKDRFNNFNQRDDIDWDDYELKLLQRNKV